MDKQLKTTVSATGAFATAFHRLDETRFVGHALWREAPHLQFAVEILIDGEPVALVRAEHHSAELAAAEGAAGDHGFVYLAKKQQLAGSHQIEARIANLAVPIGTPIDLKFQSVADSSIEPPGRVDWLGGLRLVGTVTGRGNACSSPSQINVHENGALIAQANARRWVSASGARDELASAHFEIHLPEALAEGHAHRLTITDEAGRELEGSPVPMLAFPDALKKVVEGKPYLAAEQMRAEWFDRFLPMSVPFENYSTWKERFALPPLTLDAEPPVRVVIVGDEDPEPTFAHLDGQKYDNWSATVLPSGREGSFSWTDLQEAITADAADEAIVVFLRTSVRLRDDAIAQLVKALLEHSDAAAAYGDIETVTKDGAQKPLFFGAFDYERMLEQGYAATLFAVRAKRIKIPAGEKTGTLARILLSLCDADGAQAGAQIVHLPALLATTGEEAPLPSQHEIEAATTAHLRARKIKLQLRSTPSTLRPAIHVRRHQSADTTVSIVIPTRDRVDLLAPCIESLSKTTRKHLEIVIVDNGSSAPDTLSFLKIRLHKGDRVVDAPGPFNYSHLNNVGVAAATGEVICLLNNDTEVIDPDWLDELLSRLSDPTVGAVAPKLVWPNRMVQHGGIVLGPNFAASDAFNDCLDVDSGYGDLLRVAHEATALSAACMLVRRHDYLAVKGFDEVAFPVLFNDVDFCLRLRAMGKRNVFTPHTALLHHSSATRQRDTQYSQKSRFQRELKLLRSRWSDVLANDPLYSPFLNLDPYPFSALAWPPRPSAPRVNTIAKPNIGATP